MPKMLCNPRLAKIHRNYTVHEVAMLFGKHRNTVRQWIKVGLPICDDKRPVLILGQDLRDFLQRKRTANKHPCLPGQLFCLRCKNVNFPAGDMVDYFPTSSTGGRLMGICPICDSWMYQTVGLARLEKAKRKLEVTTAMASSRIDETNHAILHCDFN